MSKLSKKIFCACILVLCLVVVGIVVFRNIKSRQEVEDPKHTARVSDMPHGVQSRKCIPR